MRLEGRRIRIEFLGCRVNAAEAEALASAFSSSGATLTSGSDFDVAVVVSCSVTAVADRKSRQLLSRLRRASPDALLVATGCWAQAVGDAEARDLGVDLLVGNRLKGQIVGLVADRLDGAAYRTVKAGLTSWDELPLSASFRHSRAFIKVQEGCDRRCTYCIIPFLRGPSTSRSPDDVEAEARRAIEGGASELVLTGVHLGLYGRDLGSDLAALIIRLGRLDGLRRLRLGSLEPFGVSDSLLDAMVVTPAFCHHLHLPVQSGDDDVLRRMGRGYSRADFLRLVERLRGRMGDDLHLSTDLMVAFPGESDRAFERTLSLLDEARVGRVHPFVWSSREGTAATAMDGRVPMPLARERLARLTAKGVETLAREGRRWIGRPVTVFVERGGRRPRGYTDAYLDCLFPAGQPRGVWVSVTPRSFSDGSFRLGPTTC